MMTTNLTLGRPYRLPFDDESTAYFYDPKEWVKFFPAYIMKWLADHPRQLTETTPEKRKEQAAEWQRFEPCKPLPAPEHMPIVIAVRMSLSFPLLISAVPLWTADRSRILKDKETGSERLPKLERCVFSDGGISSNFPIHFFDRPLPRWPTFGIDLQNFHPDFPRDPQDQSKNSYLVRTNAGGPTSGIVSTRRVPASRGSWASSARFSTQFTTGRIMHRCASPVTGIALCIYFRAMTKAG
jgi:hypothetical protein